MSFVQCLETLAIVPPRLCQAMFVCLFFYSAFFLWATDSVLLAHFLNKSPHLVDTAVGEARSDSLVLVAK